MPKKERIPSSSGNERDWTSKNWRRLLCCFKNRTGLGKKVKHAMNRRARRKSKSELIHEEGKAECQECGAALILTANRFLTCPNMDSKPVCHAGSTEESPSVLPGQLYFGWSRDDPVQG